MDKEHIKGAADKAKGAVKDAAGKMMDDKGMQAEGKMDKAKGEARQALGDAKDAVQARQRQVVCQSANQGRAASGRPFCVIMSSLGAARFGRSVGSSSSALYAPPSAPSLLGGAPRYSRSRGLRPLRYAALCEAPETAMPSPANPTNDLAEVSGTAVSVKCPTPKAPGFDLNSP